MRVLFVSSGNSEFFKTAPFILTQGESLIKIGVNVDFFYIKGKGFKGYLKNINLLRKHIKEFKPDIIHAHYSLTGWISVFADRKNTMVLSLMGSDVHGGKTKPLVNFFLMVQVYLIQFFNKVIIVKSKNLSSVIWMKKKVKLIPNGVNYDIFIPMDKKNVRDRLSLDQVKKYLLFAGNPKDSNKNFELLERAIKYIKTENIDILTPYPVPHYDLPLYYNACDVLVFPSIKEGSPNVIKEALACNTKIVATPSGDIIERTKGLSNVLISEFDELDLAVKIDILLNDQTPIRSRELVRDEIDDKIIAKELLKIYEGIQK